MINIFVEQGDLYDYGASLVGGSLLRSCYGML